MTNREQPNVPGISRRTVVRATAMGAAAAAVARMPASARQTPVVAPANEAPALSGQVEAGDLPPLGDRLPTNPLVVTPFDEIGQYGGEIRRAMITPEDTNAFATMVRTTLLEWSTDGSFQPVPGLAESWEVNDEATVYSFRLREGIRWSDGEPFTTDDLMFWYNAVLSNQELTPSFPTWLVTEGENAEFVQVDELTLEMHFARPMGLLPRFLASNSGAAMMTPKHYLSRFHPGYADQADLEAELADDGAGDWMAMFEAKNDLGSNPDRPVLGAWKIAQAIEGGSTRAVAERNPYYWKIDTDGNQLPYINEIVHDVLDRTAIVLRAANGEIDLQARHLAFEDMPVLQEAADESGAFDILQWTWGSPWPALYMNQSHSDPAMRDLMANIDFRAGLSHAINRDEMNEILFLGLGGTQHPCGVPEDPYHVDGFGYRFTEYDEDEANSRLDAAGLTERDGDGFRLRPDGEELSITILFYEFANGLDTYELVKQYWDAVGVRTVLDQIDRTLWSERVQSNQVDVAGYLVSGFLWDIEPLWYVPVSNLTYWAPGFGTYYATNGNNGEEPSEIPQQLQDLYEEMMAAPDDETRMQLGREILTIHDENVFMIGAIMVPFQPTVVNAGLGNVLQEAIYANSTHAEDITRFDQVFYREV